MSLLNLTLFALSFGLVASQKLCDELAVCSNAPQYFKDVYAWDLQQCDFLCNAEAAADCDLYTFYSDIDLCYMFKSCGDTSPVTGTDTVTSGNREACDKVPQCEIPDKTCEGIGVGAPAAAASPEDCRDMCKEQEGCRFYIYDGTTCSMTSTCEVVDAAGIIYGQSLCEDIIYEVLPNGFNGQLMIVGGITPPRSANVEVVDFSGTTDGRCGEETEDYSIAAFELVGTSLNGQPLVCGGTGGDDDVPKAECYKYTKANVQGNKWEAAGSLTTPRYLAAATLLGANEWWVTGGLDDANTVLDTTEVITDADVGGVVGDTLPGELSEHAVVRIDDDNAFIVGGRDAATVWIYTRNRVGPGTFVQKDPLDVSRTRPFAGLVTIARSGIGNLDQQFIVVAGGYDYDSNTWPTSTQIYSLADDQWIQGGGPDFPVERWAGASVQDAVDSFLAIGGSNSDGTQSNEIYWYQAANNVADDAETNVANGAWVKNDRTLATARQDFAAFLVDPSAAFACGDNTA